MGAREALVCDVSGVQAEACEATQSWWAAIYARHQVCFGI